MGADVRRATVTSVLVVIALAVVALAVALPAVQARLSRDGVTSACDPVRAQLTRPLDLTFSGELTGRVTQNCGAAGSVVPAPPPVRCRVARTTDPRVSPVAAHALRVIVDSRAYELVLKGTGRAGAAIPFILAANAFVGDSPGIGSVTIARTDRPDVAWNAESGSITFTSTGGSLDVQLRPSHPGGQMVRLRGSWLGEPPCQTF